MAYQRHIVVSAHR